MELLTKNGWLLTEYTGEILLDQFEGTKEDLVEYVLSHDVEWNMFNRFHYEGSKYWAVKPRIFLGKYDLHPDEEGIVAIGRR